jgi:hypothetical protein
MANNPSGSCWRLINPQWAPPIWAGKDLLRIVLKNADAFTDPSG